MFSSGTPPGGRERPSFGLSSGLSQTRSINTEDDVFSSVSAHGADNRPSVTGLRDRLLREARTERARCLEVAEAAERRRAELHGVIHASTQTDPVTIVDGGIGASAMPTSLVGGPSPVGTTSGARAAWSQDDEAAQNEAIRTIQLLKDGGGQSRRVTDSRISELEAQMLAEQAGRQEYEMQVSHERSRKDAAQQQVLCLEYELDGKEAALQVAERALEQRDADLQQAQLQLRAYHEGSSQVTSPSGDDTRFRALRAQLLERERQLELKDQHISRLLNVLRQHRQIFVEEDGTPCGNPYDGLNMTTMTTAAAG